MLTGIIMDIMEPVYEVCHTIGYKLLLVGGEDTSQDTRSSLPKTMLVGVFPAFSWDDALQPNRKINSLYFQYLWWAERPSSGTP
jgi:hypothetical protein